MFFFLSKINESPSPVYKVHFSVAFNAARASFTNVGSIKCIYSKSHLLLGSLLLLHDHGCPLLNHLQLIIVRQDWGRHAGRLHAHVHAGWRPSWHHADGWHHAHTGRHGRHGHGGHGRHAGHLEPQRRTSSQIMISLVCLSVNVHFS